jgi:hypothetical protein
VRTSLVKDQELVRSTSKDDDKSVFIRDGKSEAASRFGLRTVSVNAGTHALSRGSRELYDMGFSVELQLSSLRLTSLAINKEIFFWPGTDLRPPDLSTFVGARLLCLNLCRRLRISVVLDGRVIVIA